MTVKRKENDTWFYIFKNKKLKSVACKSIQKVFPDPVHRTTISHALHKSGLYERVARGELLLKQSHAVCHKPCGGFNKHVEEGALVR